MALRKFLILRRPRSGRLEGRTAAGPVAPLVRLALLALFLAVTALPAAAEDLAAVAGLAADSFADKQKAIVELAKTGDSRAVPVLQALGDDRLRRAPDGRVVLLQSIGGTTKLVDAATGQQLTDLSADSLDRIIV